MARLPPDAVILASIDFPWSRKTKLLTDGEKLFGLQARTTDEAAIDIRHCHEILSIPRLHRSSVDDPQAFGGFTKPLSEGLANESVHLRHVVGGWRLPSTDGPHRLVSDNEVLRRCAIGNRACELAGDNLKGPSALTVGPGLSDAGDRHETGAPSTKNLIVH